MNTMLVESRTETKTFAHAHRCLTEWVERCPDDYRDLFQDGTASRDRLRGDIAPLEELGLVEVRGDILFAPKCLYPFGGMFILCDRPTDERLDRVFPIFNDESVLLAAWMDVRPGDIVLDLGTGSGIVALHAAKRGARRVIASDINESVHESLEMSLRLNGLADRVEYVHSDAFEGLVGQRFDVIATNPPFVPVPQSLDYYIHSDGGPLGTAVVERILKRATRHLSDSGRFYMLALSLGGPARWRIDSLLANDLPSQRTPFSYWTEAIYEKPLLDLGQFTQHFERCPDHIQWVSDLRTSGYDRLGYFAVYGGCRDGVARAELDGLTCRLRGPAMGFWHDYVGSMPNRLRRYSGPS